MTNNLTIHFTKTVTALLLFLVFYSCTKDKGNLTLDETIIGGPSAPAGGRTSLPVVSLKVTIFNADAEGNAYNIRHDGNPVYLNGVDYVEAVLDQSGTFAFNTFKSSVKGAVAKRYVVYDLSNPVNPNNTYRPSPSNSLNYHFSTGGSQYGTQPFIPLQNLGINGNPATECIYMGNSFGNSTKTWRVSFRKGYENTATSPTAFAVVTRTKLKAVDGVDEWVMQPVGTCSPNTNVAALRSGSGTRTDPEVLHGYYNLPFYFVLTPQ